MTDVVNHPPHYLQHASGVEAIELTEALTFNLGNAVKYLLRYQYKATPILDLRKALWYIDREIERRDNDGNVFVLWVEPAVLQRWLAHETQGWMRAAVQSLCMPSRTDASKWTLDLGFARGFIAEELQRLEGLP